MYLDPWQILKNVTWFLVVVETAYGDHAVINRYKDQKVCDRIIPIQIQYKDFTYSNQVVSLKC